LLRGPVKVATHAHLQNLKLSDTSEFETLAYEAFESIILKNPDDFVESIVRFSALLRAHKLALPESIEIQDWLKKCPQVMAVKGCGALGADVIMTVVPMKAAAAFQSYIAEKKLEVVSRLSQMSVGLKVDEMTHDELQSKFESEINFFREEVVNRDVVL
jgi:hypothetical protein